MMAVGPIHKVLIHLLLTAFLLQISWAKEDWTFCKRVQGCYCKWVNGKKQASCQGANLTAVPTLHEEIQTLSLENNQFEVLSNNVFMDAGLFNLQGLSLQSCRIKVIEKNAFNGLSIVIEISLNGNSIRKLEPSTFAGTEKLRVLYLNDNEIEKIDDGLFSNLVFLQQVQLKNNRITKIGQNAFNNVPVLRNVYLDNNRLNHISLKAFENMNTLTGLSLSNNPWNCDCHMRDFVVWASKKSLYSTDTVCDQPHYLKGWPWNNITSEKFACRPNVEVVSFRTESDAERLILMCKVMGDPRPETYWTFNSRTLNNGSMTGLISEPKYINFESKDKDYWLNVTVQKVGRQDHGVYKCVTKNSAGISEVNVTISEDQPFFPFTKSSSGDVWVLLLCLLIGIICALLFIFMLCFLCCRRVDTLAAKKPASMAVSTNGDISHHIVLESEQQKTLLTAVNPVQKPPRKYDSSPHSDNGGTELTELNRNLLDDSSVLGTSVTGDSVDDHHSTNSLERMSSHSQENLLLQERLRPSLIRAHCPPDLLSFPNRRHQASPVGSCVSSDMDCAANNRFKTLHSPLHSPVYQMHPFAPSYETLPYSRTQSPFSPTGMGPAVLNQRSGYVTIPRRPRVPSWSNAPTPTMETSLKDESPVYDNLGPRTTADGSSVLSLPRKVLAEGSGTPRLVRPVPTNPSLPYTSHTLPHKSKLNYVYLSIRQKDEPQFHPVKENNGVIRPLPLPFPTQATPPPTADMDARRASWATTSKQPESGILKKTMTESPRPKEGDPVTSTPNPTTKSKVPPIPPPKPKMNGPLFEDEGEDGTEV